MQPAWSRYVRRESAPPPARSAAARVTRGAAPVGRTSGTVAPAYLDDAPALSRQANFATSIWGDAFWLSRTQGDETGTGALYVSSGARVLRDVRGECGLSSGAAYAWDADLFVALRDRLTAAGVPLSMLPREGAPPTSGGLPSGWLSWALWYTYDREAAPRFNGIALPALLLMPNVNGTFTDASPRASGVFGSFDPARLSINPFVRASQGGAASAPGGVGAVTLLLLAAGAKLAGLW